jgi:hypothetical protein
MLKFYEIRIYLGDVVNIFVFELNGTKLSYFEDEKPKFIKFKLQTIISKMLPK